MTIILGIDPGSRITGYGIINKNAHKCQYVASGCINTKSEDLSERLQQIFAGISQVIQTYHPQQVAIEQVFLAKNFNSALKLGQARGAAITAVATLGLKVTEYSARTVKQTVVGYGAAEKLQIQQMVKRLLNLSDVPPPDAADALAVAICHAHHEDVLEGNRA